jgi:hypothetical protein
MAREAIRRIKEGKPAIEPPAPKPESVAMVVDNWVRRHVDKNKLRTAGELSRVVDRYILPYWATSKSPDRDHGDILFDRTQATSCRADVATVALTPRGKDFVDKRIGVTQHRVHSTKALLTRKAWFRSVLWANQLGFFV